MSYIKKDPEESNSNSSSNHTTPQEKHIPKALLATPEFNYYQYECSCGNKHNKKQCPADASQKKKKRLSPDPKLHIELGKPLADYGLPIKLKCDRCFQWAPEAEIKERVGIQEGNC